MTFSNLSTITAGATQRINVSPNTLVTITLNGNGSTGNTLIVPTPASVVIAGTQLPAAGITCSADLDQDGICDTWEVANTPLDYIPIGSATYSYKDGAACPRLIDDRTTPFVDAGNPNTCPSPTKKDVFVEIDYMQNHRPSNAALLAVVNAYASAPTATISGVTPGITLHIQSR